MTYTFKLARRIARLRAPVLALILLTLLLVGCSATDSFDPDSSNLPTAGEQGDVPATAAAAFAGGIPFGTYAQPTNTFGDRYNGGLRNIWPQFLRDELAEIKGRGGRIVLMMAGNEDHYRDGDGHFSLTKWKARIDLFRDVDFDSYINDGTIVAHYLIDEPNDPANWSGRPVPGSTLEEMAKYSKQIWPSLTTVVRTDPGYLAGENYHYLDAAWAQYVHRKGSAADYLARNLSDANRLGLGLIVGLNIIKGGPNGSRMTASQVEEWGSTLLTSSYPCAFISWQYDAGYLSSGGVQNAMDVLRRKAESRSTRSCRGTAAGSTPPPPPPPSTPPPPAPTPTSPVPGAGALPFGLFSAPMEEYSDRWTGTLYKATPAAIAERLDRAQSSGMKVIVMLAPTGRVRNPNGTFSLPMWKAQVDRFRGLQLSKYISSKALYLHDLVDQPNCARCWGGKVIPWQTVEEMARYSKSIWPSLPTTARVAPSELAAANFRWTYL
ncbi:MAG: hypothetical protein M3477_02130, partial [Gemmatimonadota bacterium]|nr:hypothetical protein [Gemmatimonadota bacterium]